MKRGLFLTLASLISLLSFSQTVIDNPKFSATTAGYVKITKIELHDTVTIIDFEVDYKPKWWIQVMEDETYIQNSKGGEKLYVESARGIKLNEQHNTPESGKNIYTLYFPPIDKSIETIDFMQKQWKILDIELKPQEHFSIIPEPIKGNWLRTDGSNEWIFGFYDNMVIYKNESWNQILISGKGKTYQMSLQKEGKHEIIHIKLSKKGKLLIGTNPDKLELFSQKKTNNPAYIIKDDTEFKLPVFKSANAVYKGFIKGYHPKMGSTGMVYVDDIISNEQNSHLITINPDGTFMTEFPMIHPQGVYVRMLGISETVFLEPGISILHYINLPEYNTQTRDVPQNSNPEWKSLFMGECAKINSDLKAMDSIRYFNYNKVQKKILNMSAEEFKAYCLEIMERENDALKEFTSNNIVSKKASLTKQMQIRYSCSEHILSYRMYKSSAYRKKHKVPREQREIPLEFEKLSPEYYDFINASELNNPISLSSGGAYNSLINRLRFADCIRPEVNFIYVALMDSIEQKDIEITEKERILIERLIDCETWDCISGVLKEDTATWNSFNRQQNDLMLSLRKSAYMDLQRKNWNKYFGLSEGLVTEIFLAQYKYSAIKGQHKPFSDGDKEEIRSGITNEFIVEYLMQRSKSMEDEIAKKIEANRNKVGYVVNETPKTEGDKLFDAIMQKYKGKVVFVDFWATWCSPCLSGIERIKPLKEELKDKDIAFVYITNQTSPTDTWNMLIPDIKGEHYRVEEDEWNFISSKFNIGGIPHYVLVDKDGRVVEDKLFFASSNSVLSKILAQYLDE